MIEVTFSDGHVESIANVIEWNAFLEHTHRMTTNYWATITSDMYDTALSELNELSDDVADRVKVIIMTAKENNIESYCEAVAELIRRLR